MTRQSATGARSEQRLVLLAVPLKAELEQLAKLAPPEQAAELRRIARKCDRAEER